MELIKHGFNLIKLVSATVSSRLLVNNCLSCHNLVADDNQLMCPTCLNDLDLYVSGKEYQKINPMYQQQFSLSYVDRIAAVAKYQTPFTKLLPQLKFHQKLCNAKLFAQLIDGFFPELPWPQFDFVCPVPLHIRRRIDRGFNQVELIVKHSKYLSQFPSSLNVTRTKYTAAQSELNKLQRNKNIKNAFACSADLTGKRVLIIDDVITTGVTVNELALTLKKCNASSVYVLALCVRELN